MTKSTVESIPHINAEMEFVLMYLVKMLTVESIQHSNAEMENALMYLVKILTVGSILPINAKMEFVSITLFETDVCAFYDAFFFSSENAIYQSREYNI